MKNNKKHTISKVQGVLKAVDRDFAKMFGLGGPGTQKS